MTAGPDGVWFASCGSSSTSAGITESTVVPDTALMMSMVGDGRVRRERDLSGAEPGSSGEEDSAQAPDGLADFAMSLLSQIPAAIECTGTDSTTTCRLLPHLSLAIC
jgi:hypothetical protein